MINIVEVSFTEDATGEVKYIFEGGFNFLASEARNNFDSTYSPDQEAIGEISGRYF